MALTERPDSGQQTCFCSARDGAGPGLVAINTPDGTASGIVLIDTGGVERVLWFKSDGDLMTGTRANFDTPNAAGTVVGSQS